jgi:CBS domain-containing protein
VGLVAGDIMQPDVETVQVDLPVIDLERRFCESRQSGFPVIADGDRLVGVVSRADIVRKLTAEHSEMEDESAYYWDVADPSRAELDSSLGGLEVQFSQPIGNLRVEDVMSSMPITVTRTTPVREVARTLLERRIHRLPVVDSGLLVGIITSTDLVRLVAESGLG